MKIGQYLAKLWTRVYSVRFLGHPVYAVARKNHRTTLCYARKAIRWAQFLSLFSITVQIDFSPSTSKCTANYAPVCELLALCVSALYVSHLVLRPFDLKVSASYLRSIFNFLDHLTYQRLLFLKLRASYV